MCDIYISFSSASLRDIYTMFAHMRAISFHFMRAISSRSCVLFRRAHARYFVSLHTRNFSFTHVCYFVTPMRDIFVAPSSFNIECLLTPCCYDPMRRFSATLARYHAQFLRALMCDFYAHSRAISTRTHARSLRSLTTNTTYSHAKIHRTPTREYNALSHIRF